MPALLAPLVGFAVGVALRALSARGHGAAAATARLERRVVVAFAALVFTPICGYFLLFAGDWTLAYLVDPRRVPSALELLLLVVDGASVLAGFLAAVRASAAPRRLAALGAIPAAAALLLLALLADRLQVDSTFAQVGADFGGRPLAGSPLGYAVLCMGVLLFGGFTVALRALRELSREPARAPSGAAGEPPLSPEPPRRLGRPRPRGTAGV